MHAILYKIYSWNVAEQLTKNEEIRLRIYRHSGFNVSMGAVAFRFRLYSYGGKLRFSMQGRAEEKHLRLNVYIHLTLLGRSCTNLIWRQHWADNLKIRRKIAQT